MKLNYKHTVLACFGGYICQAVILNFPPLLFLTFSELYGISTEELAAAISINFAVQLLVDIVASRYADRIGYRPCLVTAHILCAAGLTLLSFLPDLIGGFTALIIPTVVYAVGAGLLEVLTSPVVEGCPAESRSGLMSIMHSFYCWGVVLTVLVSTLLFGLLGIENWRLVSLIWAILPILNAIMFLFVPINQEHGEARESSRAFIKTPAFFAFLLIMLCGGAAELSISQWASAFAESALGVEKSVGDLVGVCGFAVTMGTARALYAAFSKKISLRLALTLSGVLCVCGYLLISLSSNSTVSLLGCALTGFSVGIFWPGTLSYASSRVKGATASMFGLLALAGDIGCSVGPLLVGSVSSLAGGDMKLGFLSAAVFPIILIITLLLFFRRGAREK